MRAMPDAPALADYPGWWLEARCSCGRSTQIPVRLLVQEWRGESLVGDIARRLRCRRCGARPEAAELVEDPQADARGYVGGGPGRRISV